VAVDVIDAVIVAALGNGNDAVAWSTPWTSTQPATVVAGARSNSSRWPTHPGRL